MDNPQRNLNMKYTLNENYFETINSANKAYWLGLIAADGSVSELQPGKRNQRLQITLKYEDKYILEKFKASIKYTGPILEHTIKTGKYQGHRYVSILFTCNKMAQDLSKYNIIPRKTYIFSYPNIPEKYTFDFIRGYFDGDGSVFISHEKHWRNGTIVPVIHFRFIGTESLMKAIQAKLNLGGSLVKSRNSSTYELCYKHNKKALEFFSKIYANKTLYLKRKYNIFKDVQRL